MKRLYRAFVFLIVLQWVAGGPAAAQVAPKDTVLQRIWEEGMSNSRLYPLAQVLLDSIGPRLTGSPAQQAAQDWAVSRYESWGIPARSEPYGTWKGWRRGITHIDLVAPRVRSLEGTMLAWSPATQGPVEGAVAFIPELPDAVAFEAWLPQVSGKFVLVSFPQPTCRPDENWQEYATPESLARMQQARAEARAAWGERLRRTGLSSRALLERLESAGAAGILTSRWSQGWGVNKLFGTHLERIPVLDLSCEDYGLVARLALNGQEPRLRVEADAEFLGEVPVSNTVAEIRGRERPDEYVLLSAHFDSWDGASGATDNGTGTLVMMEAMRILQAVYPHPRRTILAGHWGGEEQGLNGSRAFAEDHPGIVEGIQAVFNQDNGTGRIHRVSMSGFPEAEGFFTRWFAQMPPELTQEIELISPGAPSRGGSDHASFLCHGVPAFFLSALGWDYGTYTWHTNRDTFDKIVFDDLRQNAVLVAMLAYLASEEPDGIAHIDRADHPRRWPECVPAERSLN